MQSPQPIDLVPIALAEGLDARNTSIDPAMHEPQWLLFCEWVAYFLTAQVPSVASTGIGNKNAHGGATWKCTTSDNTVGVEFDELPATKEQRVVTWGISQDSHNALLGRAASYSDTRNTRQVLWHATFNSKEQDPFVASTALHFARGLDHARRLVGRVGFGSAVLLDFSAPESSQPTLALFSPVHAKAYFLIDGAYAGPYTSRIAEDWIPTVRACVSFCLGTPVHIGKFRPLGPEEEVDLVATLKSSPVGQQLAIEHFPLGDALQTFVTLGAAEAAHRVFRAIACFETAMQQGNEAATTIHLVTAVEALARPNYKKAWHNRVTQRYHEFLQTCIPDKIVEVLGHLNLSSAFPTVKSKEELVAAIYDARSAAVHSGHTGEFHEFFGGDRAIRVMLIADLVRSAIIEFAKRPFTSLVGHPSVDKDINVKVDNRALAILRRRAAGRSISVEEYITSLAHSLESPQ